MGLVKQTSNIMVLVRRLAETGSVSKDFVFDALWGHDEDGGPLSAEKIIHIYICHIRKALRPGWTLRNVRGEGYVLIAPPGGEMRSGTFVDRERRSVCVDGCEYALTPQELQIVSEMLEKGVITRQPHLLPSLQVHIHNIRKRVPPLNIRCIGGGRYEIAMADPKKTRPKVEQAIKAIRGALKESSIAGGMGHGKIDISDTTGIGKTTHSTDDVQIDVIVTPKESAGDDD